MGDSASARHLHASCWPCVQLVKALQRCAHFCGSFFRSMACEIKKGRQTTRSSLGISLGKADSLLLCTPLHEPQSHARAQAKLHLQQPASRYHCSSRWKLASMA